MTPVRLQWACLLYTSGAKGNDKIAKLTADAWAVYSEEAYEKVLDILCEMCIRDRLNREKPTTMRKLEDIWYEGNGSSWENRNAHYNSSRYHMLNLHATFTKGTKMCIRDSSGGFPLGGLLTGQITPLWSSEVEPFAIRVTTKRLPWVKDVYKRQTQCISWLAYVGCGHPCW